MALSVLARRRPRKNLSEAFRILLPFIGPGLKSTDKLRRDILPERCQEQTSGARNNPVSPPLAQGGEPWMHRATATCHSDGWRPLERRQPMRGQHLGRALARTTERLGISPSMRRMRQRTATLAPPGPSHSSYVCLARLRVPIPLAASLYRRARA
jgi:hypothetical protein